MEVCLSGVGVERAVNVILREAKAGRSTVADIIGLSEAESGPLIEEIVAVLTEKGIVFESDVPDSTCDGGEGPLEIFYSNLGIDAGKVVERLNDLNLAILGMNSVSRRLANGLIGSGVESVQIVDEPHLRNPRFFNASGGVKADEWEEESPPYWELSDWLSSRMSSSCRCIVAASDFGYHKVFRTWNQLCVERNVHFVPVALENAIGYLGPIVIPGETACFECLRSRENSHESDPTLQGLREDHYHRSNQIVGYHPAMVSVLSDIAAFEITRFYSGAFPRVQMGRLIEVNLLVSKITPRAVLKVPRCIACSPLTRRSRASVDLMRNSNHA